MSKFWVICKREYLQVVKKKSFLVGIILTPVFMAAIIILPALLAQSSSQSAESIAIIDQSGNEMGSTFAESLGRYKLPDSEDDQYTVTKTYTLGLDESQRRETLTDSLRQAINDKALKYLLVMKPDPQVADTNLLLITNSDNYRSVNRFESRLTEIVSSMRLELSNVNLPVDSVLALTRQVSLPQQDTKGESIPFLVKFFGAFIFVMLIYMLIIAFGTMLMRSVIDEKNSRIMEVLISSVSPFQLMLGKVVGLGAAAFTQVLVWILLGATMSIVSGSMALEIDPGIYRMVFNPVIVISFALFFVAGYVLYSTLFALIGSIVNSDKEAQNFIFPITISLMIPVLVGSSVVQDPYQTWAVVMSFIPFFAPTMMMMRVMFVAPTLTEYSLFSGIVAEAILAWLLVVATCLFVIWIAGRIFRVGILMTGKRPTLPEIIKWIRY